MDFNEDPFDFEADEDDDDLDFDSGFTVINGTESFQVEGWMAPQDSKIKSLFAWRAPDVVPLKIAICGAGGTGKSLLARELGSRLDLPVIESLPRTVDGYGFNMSKKTDAKSESALFIAMQNELREYAQHVSAGTLIDALAYMDVAADPMSNDTFFLRAMANLTHSLANEFYTVFFYLPFSEEKLTKNGFRSVDKKYQASVDERIRYYLNSFDFDYYPLSGTPEEQVNKAWKYLRDYGLLDRRLSE